MGWIEVSQQVSMLIGIWVAIYGIDSTMQWWKGMRRFSGRGFKKMTLLIQNSRLLFAKSSRFAEKSSPEKAQFTVF